MPTAETPRPFQGHVLLMAKNGIGFGHLRRATLVAQAIARVSNLLPVVISQARSIRLLSDAGVYAVNFPQLHRCSHVLAEDAYTLILDELVHRLAPTVAVQDTYPDSRYSRLKALAGVRQLLVMRRVDSLTLDSMMHDGSMALFDEVFVCQTREEFDGEHHSPRSTAIVEGSGIFNFVGPVWRRATTSERLEARRRYAWDDQRLVVVSVGAGGDKYLDAFAIRLIEACIAATRTQRFLDNGVKMVIVTGPYLEAYEFTGDPAIEILRWEPSLHALLAEADVAVIKPGSNCLLEALDGHAALVLVPDRSYREGLSEHAKRIARTYGAAVVTPNAEAIGEAIRKALSAGRHPSRATLQSGADAIASRIVAYAGDPLARHRFGVPFGCVSLESGKACELPAVVFGEIDSESVADVGLLTRIRGGDRVPQIVLADALPISDDSAEDFVRRGARLIAPLNMGDIDPLDRWRCFDSAPRELLLARLEVFHWQRNAEYRVHNWLNRLAQTPRQADGAVLLVRSSDELSAASEALVQAFRSGTSLPQLVPLRRLTDVVARKLLLGGNLERSRP